MKNFITKLLRFSLIGLIPLAIAGILYIALDPFKVLHNYDSFIDINAKGMVTLNRDYVSTTTFINNRKKINYNSFIFGNSRSIFYQVSDWEKHLKNNASCFHFDASAEALWAINKKVEYLDKTGNKIENILLILDYSILIQDKPKWGHLGIISPALVNNSNIIDFHKTFFFAFLTPRFFCAFLDFKISGRIKPYMKKYFLLSDQPINYDILTNEMRLDSFEVMIQKNKYYTPERLSLFYKRDTTLQIYSPEIILENQKSILTNISAITKKHKTSIKIVINPLYDQLKLNKKDIAYLKSLFGDDNVFDFSGINKYTNDYKNYYEDSHYRPHVSRKLLEFVYKDTSY